MMQQSFTHEVGEDPLPRRRVRISGPIYDDSNVPLLRIEFEDGNAELIPTSEMRLVPSSSTTASRRQIRSPRTQVWANVAQANIAQALAAAPELYFQCGVACK
jgi:hypothetical protein